MLIKILNDQGALVYGQHTFPTLPLDDKQFESETQVLSHFILFYFFTLFYLTILYWFCHTST